MYTQVFDVMEGAESTLGTYIIVAIITLILMIPSICCVILYVLRSIGLFSIARRRGIHHAWVAWIPCGRDWLLGSISDHYRYVNADKKSYARFLLLLVSLPLEFLIFVSNVFVIVFPLLFINWDPTLPIQHLIQESQFADYFPLIVRYTPYFILAILLCRLLPSYRFYQSANPQHSVSLLVLSILVPFSPPVIIFKLRKHDNGMPPKQQPVPNKTEPQNLMNP